MNVSSSEQDALSDKVTAPTAVEYVKPIDLQQQERVVLEVRRVLQCAESIYRRKFNAIDVLFDLKGRAAGMYRVRRQGLRYQSCIRFNPWLFAKYPEDSWDNTIPHEVAHYIADCLYGLKKIRPHGKEWQRIMSDLGAVPTVRAHYDMSNIPTRRMKSFEYQCQCRQVSLSAHRHHKVVKGLQRYVCRKCHTELIAVSVDGVE